RVARETAYEVRFIEFMPLDADETWSASSVVPSHEVLDKINAVYPLRRKEHGPEPATVYVFEDGAPGSVGVIPSVTEPFCNSCNRIRITAEGMLRNCLFALGETDLRSLLRGGASDSEIEAAIRENVSSKWAGHHIGKSDFIRPSRSMSMIGG
ncbi:MAG: GTP 3',8-cyclase MoaA family protein, partial [Actinomycetota bacterium]